MTKTITQKLVSLAIALVCMLNISLHASNGDKVYVTESGKKFHVSKKLLLQEIKQIKKANSRVNLTFKDFKELGGNFTKEAFNNHFGSWENALEFYEIKFTDNFRLPEDKLLLAELQNIIETLGRNPSAQEMENIGKYPY